MDAEVLLLCFGLFFVSALYSSVGHGGASGYLALLSLSTYGSMESAWLKQHAWVLNLIVASLAFYSYQRAGHHLLSRSIPFILASIPFAFVGGYLHIDGTVYDTLLSIALLFAAYRLLNSKNHSKNGASKPIPKSQAYSFGAGIGFLSGIIGVGGGIFLSPILVLKRWATPKAAAATAALFILANSSAGLIGAATSGQLALESGPLLLFSLTVLLGGLVGSNYGAKYADQTTIRSLLVAVLILASLKRVIGLLTAL